MLADLICKYCGKQFRATTKPSRPRLYCSQSCGNHSSKNKRHGVTNSLEHRTWASIRRRCNSPQYFNYARYGGRGITVCARWDLFENFLADMGYRSSPNSTIERIDNDIGYEPGNCKWATQAEQNRNKSNTYTAEQDQLIQDAIARGLNFPQISELLGCRTASSVSMRAYRLGLKSGQPVVKSGRHRGSATP